MLLVSKWPGSWC